MNQTVKNVCDTCALVTGGLAVIGENLPQIAAGLSALWLALRVIELLWRWKKHGIGSKSDEE